MRSIVVLACVALAYARPEPPVGYSYPAPSNKYSAQSSSFASSSVSGGLKGISHGGYSSGGISLSSHSSGISLGTSFGGDSGFSGGYAGGYSGAPLVQKHIYVHVPPPEPQEYRAPRVPAVAPPQKHYKIIFIKAPTPPTPVAPIIPLQPQNEEKTLVYVLVKKPEEQPDIVIPTQAPTQPSKPEVYFIKYQTQKEAGGASIGGATGGADLSSVSLSSSSSSGHAGAEISANFGTSGGDESGSEGGHSGATSSQYGPPGHVAGPLH
ncbi:uncharacterized protein LOC113239768 [Hyposmocoma kahamanoa]|uniref:uncharacterized protein LOC113239768 n=1 Tax=Hyposmocoma kahamanoa TaxID=1477025 RepID=UPI000E6D66DC|nr:uncharacterized protein LOC113239768 [Hyposmocoma kahamanoa]